MTNLDTVGNKRITRNTLFLYIRMLFVLIVSLYVARVVLNTLGINDYGVFNVVAGFVSMFGFLNSSFSSCIQRYYNYEYGKNGNDGVQNVFSTAVHITIVFSVVICILLETIGVWYIDNKLVISPDRLIAAKYLFHFSTIQLLILMMQLPYSALILSKEHMDYYAIVGIVDVLFKLLILFLIPYIKCDRLILYGFLTLCISIFIFLLYFGFVRIKYSQLRVKACMDNRLYKSMLSFSGWNVFGAVAIVARTQGINILLNSFFGPIVNAARGVAFQVQSALMSFIQNISIAARPQLTESYATGNFERSTRLMLTISKISFVLLYMMVLPVSSEIDYILHLWLGDNIPEYTSIFTILILITALIDVLNTPITMIIMATGNVSLYSSVTSIVGLLIIPVSYVALTFGYNPPVVFHIGIVISIIVQITSILIMNRETGISIVCYLKQVVFPLFILVMTTFIIPFFIKYIMIEGFIRLIAVTVVSIASILAISYFVCLQAYEKEYIKEIINRVFRK